MIIAILMTHQVVTMVGDRSHYLGGKAKNEFT